MSRVFKLAGVNFAQQNLPILWDPSVFGPSLLCWFSADNGITYTPGSNAITLWNDLSGNNLNLDAVPSPNSFIYVPNALAGLPGAKSAVAPTAMSTSVTAPTMALQLNSNFAIAGVYIQGGVAGSLSTLMCTSLSSGYGGWRVGSGNAAGISGYAGMLIEMTGANGLNTVANGKTLVNVNGIPHKFIFSWAGPDGSGGALNLDGVNDLVANNGPVATPPVATGPLVMGSTNNSLFYSLATICEMMVISRLLTTQEIASLNLYFQQKWGL
jgi:hypothetical protein